MKFRAACTVVALLSLTSLTIAQTPTETPSALPRLVRFGGAVKDLNGNPLTGVVGITFALYSEQTGGAALWIETQNVTADSNGHYSALLGSTKPDGIPTELFTSGQARWVGVQASGQAEQPRVLLVSAPYALKAADAETLGGLPPSAFLLAGSGSNGGSNNRLDQSVAPGANQRSGRTAGSPDTSSDVTTTGGTVNTIPLFTTATNIQNSLLTQTGTTAVNLAGKLNVTNTVTMSGTSSGGVLQVTNTAASGIAPAVVATTDSTAAAAVKGIASATSGSSKGLFGSSSATNGYGVEGTSANVGVYGTTTGTGATNYGVQGYASANVFAGQTAGVLGVSASDIGYGVEGSSGYIGVYGSAPFGVVGSGDSVGAEGATTTSTGYGVFGTATATTGANVGVYGSTSSGTGYGVFGTAPSGGYGVYGTSPNIAVYGNGLVGSSIGVYGVYVCCGGLFFAVDKAGVWGDTESTDTAATGVFGSSSYGTAGSFTNQSTMATLFAYNYEASGDLFDAVSGAGSCSIDGSGDLQCTGSKSAVVPVDGGSRRVALYAVEAPENWFEDAGSGQLSHGSARIELEPTFSKTVNAEIDYHVFLTPKGDCEGLYVSNETPQGFEVHELRGGISNVAFDFRIMAKRRGYENIRLADKTERFNEMQKRTVAQRGKSKRRLPTAPLAPSPSQMKVPVASVIVPAQK